MTACKGTDLPGVAWTGLESTRPYPRTQSEYVPRGRSGTTYRPRSSVTTIFRNLVGRVVASAMTQTPASGPFALVTTPPISSGSIAAAPESRCRARDEGPAHTATPLSRTTTIARDTRVVMIRSCMTADDKAGATDRGQRKWPMARICSVPRSEVGSFAAGRCSRPLSAARAHVRCERPDFLTIYPIGATAGEPAFTAV